MQRNKMTNEIKKMGRHIISSHNWDVRDSIGLVNATKLAENIAWELKHDEWLDQEDHELWDIALELADANSESLMGLV